MSVDKTERPKDCTLRLFSIYRLKIHGGKQGGGKETVRCSVLVKWSRTLWSFPNILPFVCEITLVKE